MRVRHPIYGTGWVVGPAKGRFSWVRFDERTNCGTDTLAVSMNVCWRM